MNKVVLLGRLTRDVELTYSASANPVAVAKYSIAVNRKYKQDGVDVDFFNVVAFGKAAEFVNQYFSKGQQILVVGRLQVNNYTDKQGNKRTSTNVIAEEQHFAGSKKQKENEVDSYNAEEEELPF